MVLICSENLKYLILAWISFTQLLQIKDLSIREQIIVEIVVFVILLVFFVFVLLGFTALSSNQDIAAGISSVLVVIAGGGSK